MHANCQYLGLWVSGLTEIYRDRDEAGCYGMETKRGEEVLARENSLSGKRRDDSQPGDGYLCGGEVTILQDFER